MTVRMWLVPRDPGRCPGSGVSHELRASVPQGRYGERRPRQGLECIRQTELCPMQGGGFRRRSLRVWGGCGEQAGKPQPATRCVFPVCTESGRPLVAREQLQGGMGGSGLRAMSQGGPHRKCHRPFCFSSHRRVSSHEVVQQQPSWAQNQVNRFPLCSLSLFC